MPAQMQESSALVGAATTPHSLCLWAEVDGRLGRSLAYVSHQAAGRKCVCCTIHLVCQHFFLPSNDCE